MTGSDDMLMSGLAAGALTTRSLAGLWIDAVLGRERERGDLGERRGGGGGREDWEVKDAEEGRDF